MTAKLNVNLKMADGASIPMELDVRTVMSWHKAFEDALTTWALANGEAIEAELAQRASP